MTNKRSISKQLFTTSILLLAAPLLASCAANQAALVNAMIEMQRIQAETFARSQQNPPVRTETSRNGFQRNYYAQNPAPSPNSQNPPRITQILPPTRNPQYPSASKTTEDKAKERIIQTLLDSASAAYKEITGEEWHPLRLAQRGPSRDPTIKDNWWNVKEGETLHETLNQWAKRADWQIVWKSGYEYPIEAGALFIGDFPQAVQQALLAFKDAYPPIHVTFYKNRVAVVENYDGNY